MTFNLDTCKFCVWGFRPDRAYHTHSHIHAAFVHALEATGKQVMWFDQSDDITGIDFSNTLFIGEHSAVGAGTYWPWETERISEMPIRDDCFYVIHGMNDHAGDCQQIMNLKNRLSWNVYHDYSHIYGKQGNAVLGKSVGIPLTEVMWIDEEVPLYPNENHMEFRWATNLLPDEIERNKPREFLSLRGNTIWWVGTQWWVNQRELNQFEKACRENAIQFKVVGAGQYGIVSDTDNIRLIRESYMAPSISGTHHLTEGYVPCRIFKNISYGQYGVTNSLRTCQVLENQVIYNPDPYQLFFEARERLRGGVSLKQLHHSMDLIAQKHTYLNRLKAITRAVQIILEKT